MTPAELPLTPRYNIAPTDSIDALVLNRGNPVITRFHWGWKHARYGDITNAQAETATQKMFKVAWESGRCLLPATGYYEWYGKDPAQPYLVTLATKELFWFAGLHHEGRVTLLTKPASSFLRNFKDRAPVAICRRFIDWYLGEWKYDDDKPEGWAVISRSISDTSFGVQPVTREVGNPRFQSEDCLAPIELSQGDMFARPVDDRKFHWERAEEPPPAGVSVEILLDDDYETHGQWTGSEWQMLRAEGARPVMWKRQERGNVNNIGTR